MIETFILNCNLKRDYHSEILFTIKYVIHTKSLQKRKGLCGLKDDNIENILISFTQFKK